MVSIWRRVSFVYIAVFTPVVPVLYLVCYRHLRESTEEWKAIPQYTKTNGHAYLMFHPGLFDYLFRTRIVCYLDRTIFHKKSGFDSHVGWDINYRHGIIRDGDIETSLIIA